MACKSGKTLAAEEILDRVIQIVDDMLARAPKEGAKKTEIVATEGWPLFASEPAPPARGEK